MKKIETKILCARNSSCLTTGLLAAYQQHCTVRTNQAVWWKKEYTQANDYRSHVKQAMQMTETNLPAKTSQQHKQT